MGIGYEEITESTGAYSHGEYDCTLCCGVAPNIRRNPRTWRLNHNEHLLAHGLEYVAFDLLPTEVRLEAQVVFGTRWYREFWYYRHQVSGEWVAVDVTEN